MNFYLDYNQIISYKKDFKELLIFYFKNSAWSFPFFTNMLKTWFRHMES